MYRAAEAKADSVAKAEKQKSPLVRAARALSMRRSRASKKKELSPKESIEEKKRRLLRNLKGPNEQGMTRQNGFGMCRRFLAFHSVLPRTKLNRS